VPVTETKPLTAKGCATRARIVDAAADLMMSKGARAVSLDEVCRTTSTSRSQLYHYFSSKDELVVAVVDCVRSRILSLQRSLLEQLDSFEALDRWASTMIGIQRQASGRGGCPLGTLASELADSAVTARVELEAAFEEWEDLIASGLRSMQERGELVAAADTEQLATAVLASLQGGLLMAKTARDVAPPEASLSATLGYLRTFSANAGGRRVPARPRAR